MILVVIGHMNNYNAFVKPWIYSFHMPLFFILSGIVIKNKSAYDWKDNLLNKLKYIYLPYVIWAMIYGDFTYKNILYILYGSYQGLLFSKSNTNLWFFPTFVTARLLTEALIFITKKINNNLTTWIVRIISATALFTIGFFLPDIKIGWPLGFNNALIGCAFMVFGISVKNLFHIVQNHLIAAASIGTISMLVSFTFLLNNPTCGYIHMGKGDYGECLLFILPAIFGSIFVIMVGNIIGKILKEKSILSRLLQFIGRNTFVVLAVQYPTINIVSSICNKFLLNDVIALLVSFVLTMGICCVIAFVCNCTAPFLNGKKFK